MTSEAKSSLRKTWPYILCIVGLGLLAIVLSFVDVSHKPFESKWLLLAGLTLLSGLLSVKLSAVAATISVSETFVFVGTLLYGPSVGTILVLLDVLVVSTRVSWSKTRRIRWEQVLFNIAANPLCLWVAATVVGIQPLSASTFLGGKLITQLAAFAVLDFLFNSGLVTVAIVIEKSANFFTVWWGFRTLLLNYLAGASIAALVVVTTRTISPASLALIVPLMLVLFYTYKWSFERVEKAEKHLAEMKRVFMSTIEALSVAIEAKDEVTGGHVQRVKRYALALAAALGMTDEGQLDALSAASMLHDTGKLATPEYILNKPGPLTSSEFEKMKDHAAIGADIIRSIDFPYPVEPIVRHHHENWDGTGYPAGLKADNIPLGARILSVVDCYDALTSDRPYRPRMTRQQAEQLIRERSGKMYEPRIVEAFLALLDQLERDDDAERAEAKASSTSGSAFPVQLDVIAATTAEEREFNELRRDLPKSESIAAAADVLFRHIRRIMPASTLALYLPQTDRNRLDVVACAGVGASTVQALQVPVGERISGWVFAHKQVVVNSDATLELGPVARTLSEPLRYALVVPLMEGAQAIAVVAVFGTSPFEKDHRRMLETAATLFHPSISLAVPPETKEAPAAANKPKQQIH